MSNNLSSPLKLTYSHQLLVGYKVNKPGEQDGEYIDKSIVDDLFKALETAYYEVKDWYEYNYNQIESFDNNGTNNERDMQADVANGIYEKLQIIKAAMSKAVGQ